MRIIETAMGVWANLSNREHHNEVIAEAFDKGKKISDFVGMLIRLGFCAAFVAYFFAKLTCNTAVSLGLWKKFAFGICVVQGSFFAIYLYGQMSLMISSYFLRDIASARGWSRGLIVISSFALTAAVTQGVVDIALSIASSSRVSVSACPGPPAKP